MMAVNLRALAVAALLALALDGTAATFGLTPMRVELSAASPTAIVTVNNAGDAPVTVQVQAYAWSQPEGKDVYAEVFRLYCLRAEAPGGQDGPTYRAVAVQLGLKEHDVRNYLSACRTMLRQLLRERVREIVATADDVDAELAAILGKR